jgi:hypothetical protein
MFQPVANTVEARLFYNLDDGPDIINTLHFRDNVHSWDGAAQSYLADEIETWWNAELKPLQHSDLVLQKIVVKDLEAEYPFSFEKVIGDPGTRAGTAAAGALAAIVHWTGDPGNPPRLGTIFHPGMAEADVDGNLISQAYADDVLAAYDAARAINGVVSAAALVLVSRYSGSTLVERPNGTKYLKPTLRDPAVTNTIGDTRCSRRIGIQKRRRPSPL